MIRIVPYEDRYNSAWRKMSFDWLEEFDLFEPEDLHLLDHPYETAINPGGTILIALKEDVPVGTVSLLPAGSGVWEIAKLTVKKPYRGCGIADMLMEEALKGIRIRKGHTALLFTNSCLTAAIALYQKWGFTEVAHHDSAYCESDRRFEKKLL